MKHKARPVGQVLSDVLQHMDSYSDLLRLQLLQNWSGLLDVPQARYCRPVRFDGDVLILEALSESWANELRAFEHTLLKILNEQFKQLNVKAIKII